MVDSTEGGALGCCAREREGEAPTILVSLSQHGGSMTLTLTPANAAALGLALMKLAAFFQREIDIMEVRSGTGSDPEDAGM